MVFFYKIFAKVVKSVQSRKFSEVFNIPFLISLFELNRFRNIFNEYLAFFIFFNLLYQYIYCFTKHFQKK